MRALRDVAEDLVNCRVSLDEAGRLAKELTAGFDQVIGGLPRRVLRGMCEVEAELKKLSDYVNSPTATDPQRWAGSLLIVHAQLGAGNLGIALDLVRRILAPGTRPAAVERYEVAMIDAIIAALPPSEGRQAAWWIGERRRILGDRRGLAPPARHEPQGRTDSAPSASSSAEGLQFHQLGNSLVSNGNLAQAVDAFSHAIEIRTRLCQRAPTPEERSWLAGSYKMRATAYMGMFLGSGGLEHLHKAAQSDISKALEIRRKLRSHDPADPTLAHDYAMTLWTRAWIEGSVWNFPPAMEDLSAAVGLLRELVYVQGRATWLPDLAMCLADRVKFGVGATQKGYKMALLEEAEECAGIYADLLRSGTLTVRAKYLEFLAHGASPAAFFLGQPGRAASFLTMGLDEIERVLAESGPDGASAAGLGPFFAIPDGTVDDLARRHGLDGARYRRLKKAAGSR
jgi:hypothetical protein